MFRELVRWCSGKRGIARHETERGVRQTKITFVMVVDSRSEGSLPHDRLLLVYLNANS